ncbi:MAG: AAA family ATPase [Actinobacteria bacterium]|nr:AAA family ATPase [Actinomycetota bacterium]
MELRILGPVEIVDEQGASVPLRGGRERALIALLVLSANRVVPSDSLAEELRGNGPPEGADHALRVYASRLRKALQLAGAPEVLVTRPPGYLLQVDLGSVDAARFEAAVAEGEREAARGDHQRAAATLRAALCLWRGPALADVEDVPTAQREAARLEEKRLAALERRIDSDMACGGHRQLVAELDALTATHPLRERFWAQRMVALYRTGRQTDALRAYQELRTALRDELGLEPSSELRDLEGAILRHDSQVDWPPGRTGGGEAGTPDREPTAAMPMPVLLTDMGTLFVGRQHELQQFERLWAEARTGTRLVLLSGEPGVGKTRLAAEFAGEIHAVSATVLAGRCDEDLGVPYQPFVEALRHFVEHTPPGELNNRLGRHAGELVRLHPDLAVRVPDLTPPLRSDPETERYRLFDAVTAWLAAASLEHPVLLVLDDLQWAAKPTLLLLRHVVRHPEPPALLIVAAYRDTELGDGHPLPALLADLRRQAGIERLPLTGLGEADVAGFVAQEAGRQLDDEERALARTIHRETDGNPFFVREVIRHLGESGRLGRDLNRRADPRPGHELGVPEGVREVIGRRLSRLSEGTNRVLRMAAVVGAEFDVRLLRSACDLDDEAVIPALEEATAAHLVIEVLEPRLRYQFTHALVRDTLYADLSAARRALAHREVAQAIEALHSVVADYLPALASHWARVAEYTGEMAPAVHYAALAGDRALALLAHDDAVAYYLSGVGLLDAGQASGDDPRRLHLLLSLGEAQRRAGDAAYRQTLLDAADLARQIGDVPALAGAALANTRGHIYSAAMAIDAERVAVLEAAIDAVEATDAALRARLLANLGLELAWQADPTRRLELSAEALRLASGLGDRETMAHVLLARDYTITAPENARERLAATTAMLATSERSGDPALASRALALRFKAAMELADVPAAERCLATNGALVADLGQPALTWAVLHHQATLRILRCSPDAEQAIDAAHDFGVKAGQVDIAVFSASQRIALFLDQARLGEIEPFIVQVAERTGHPMVKGMYAIILAETDRLPAAAMVVDELAATGFAHPTNNVAWLRFAADCAWLCARLGRPEHAPTLRARLEPHDDQLVLISLAGAVTGSVAFYLALLAATTGEWQRAEDHFAVAAATHERIQAPSWLARTRLEWARMLLRRAGPGDKRQADDLLRRALTTARHLGLPNIEREATLLSQLHKTTVTPGAS